MSRIDDLSEPDLAVAISNGPGPALVAPALRLLDDSGGWRTGESRMISLILPLASHLDLEQLKAVHQTLRTNSQVREASGVPPAVDTLFQETVQLPGALQEWDELSRDLETMATGYSDYYAYPQLRSQIDALTG